MKKSIISAEYALFLVFLKQTRLDSGITQIQLAKKLKTGQSAISKVEAGERRIDVVELRQWARALGMPLTDFVAGFEAYLKKNRKSPKSSS